MNKALKVTLIVLAALVLLGGAIAAGWYLGGLRVNAATASIRGFGTTQSGDDQFVRPFLGQGGRPSRGFGGMMGGDDYGGMMGGGNYGGMMGGNRPGRTQGYGTTADLTPLTVDQAEQAAQAYIDGLDITGLEIGEVMVFDNNAYVRVVETDGGIGAFELLVDPVTKIAYPEMGPNMMWNLKYAALNHANMMNGRRGMMDGWFANTAPADVSAKMMVTPEQALKAAQEYLDAELAGTTVAEDAEPFYGYYTIDVLKDGEVYGMLSVNGFSGQVFYHYWHGTFIEMSEE